MAVIADEARVVFRAEAEVGLTVDAEWARKVEVLSRLCEVGGSATHIAFLVTAMLAKSVDGEVDLYAIKPTHSLGNQNAFSARTLCHGVVVPLAAELGVNIGVNGREPLNNQPYFRMTALGDGTPVHTRARPAFDYMVSLVDELQSYTRVQARVALRAFIAVRRRYQTVYATSSGALTVTWATLPTAIQRLVEENSEGGRRAQAVVAGLFDVFAGADQVESGRINDPSRHYPGDVAVRNAAGGWDKAVEVRDKVVAESDVYIFGRTCLAKGVREAAIVLAAPFQPRLNNLAVANWAANSGLGITLFYGWAYFVDQVLFWSGAPKAQAVEAAVATIEERLVAVQASPASVLIWHSLTRAA
ncbi:restriction endonuclease, SacI family [Acidovorax sp. GBBC 3334]|uniref:restriction endonuclease, SacI family n=1 Tax=Acidovorax sp. GBBC 3334 TaxID=2940496 RepID=UPI0023040DC0|nr:restriction endonuclease, SacI family [Acidovorax sp. GBBC 3334]MDA8457146.1 restriction endonuclease, SacI family [Acidovorax sp. GBBC 3334]